MSLVRRAGERIAPAGGRALHRGLAREFERFIAASPERVFAFYERRDAVALLTTCWSGARVVRTAASVRPGERALLVLRRGLLGVEWQAVREVYEPAMRCVEARVRGPFRSCRRRHLVLPEGDGARLRDELEYALSGGRFQHLPHASDKSPSTRTRWPGPYLAGELDRGQQSRRCDAQQRGGRAGGRDRRLRAYLLESAEVQKESRA